LSAYKAALAIDPSLVSAYVRLASLYARLGDRQAAAATLQDAKKLAPNDRDIAQALQRLDKPPAHETEARE
jgi:tetratricopeptide (TPR) repeat protein